MKKKLLAGILALALCSTNMPPQTIFAGEFTSGNPDVVSEEDTPEIFTNEEQEAAGETNEDLFVFSSEEAPEFNDTPDEAMAATENAQNGVIDLTEDANVTDGVYTINISRRLQIHMQVKVRKRQIELWLMERYYFRARQHQHLS